MRRATDDREAPAAGEAALRLWDLVEGLAGATGADLLRVAGLLRLEADGLDLVAIVVVALALLDGLGLAARVVRDFGAALVRSTTSAAGALARATAERERDRVEEPCLAFGLAAARGLTALAVVGAGVTRVR